jgi:hypothetical protein
MSLSRYFQNKIKHEELPPKFKKMQLRARRGPGELLEFEMFGNVEPSHAFTGLHSEVSQLGKRKFDNFMKIAARPGHSEKVISQLYKKFKDEDREGELEGILEAQYDPIGPWVEIQNVDEQMKIHNLTEINKFDKLVEIGKNVLFVAVLLVLLQFLGIAKCKELDPILAILAIILWHILQEFLEIKVLLEFTRSELMRIRASCTTGNLVQLLMRTEMKLNFMERRSMKYYAKSHDFFRILSEEFLEVSWFSLDAGREKFGSLVADYLESKIQRGVKIEEVTPVEKSEFKKILQESLTYHL